MTRKYQIGQKIFIPKTKSVGFDLRDSTNINIAKSKGHDYMFIVDFYNDHDYVLSYSKTKDTGDIFAEKDLIPYIESREELNKQLLNGEIDINTFNTLIKEVE